MRDTVEVTDDLALQLLRRMQQTFNHIYAIACPDSPVNLTDDEFSAMCIYFVFMTISQELSLELAQQLAAAIQLASSDHPGGIEARDTLRQHLKG